MAILSCKNISKTYIIDNILEDISFTIEEGDRIGLIGLNGSGKTTLFNILAGNLNYDQGEIFKQRNLRLGYLRQETKIESDSIVFNDCLEIFSNLIEMEEDLRTLEKEISQEAGLERSTRLDRLMEEYGQLSEKFSKLNGYGYRSDIRGVLIGLGFSEEDFDKEVEILSGGQKSRLALAKLLLQKPDLLLLDEPTNHLDIEAIVWLEKYLRDYKGTVLLISHDRYFLDAVVSRIFYLENRKLNIYNCDYSRFMEQRKKDLLVMQKQYEDQQREMKRQEEIIQRFMNYGDSRYIKQAQSRQKLLDQMKVLDQPSDSQQARISFEPSVRSGRDVLRLENLSKSFGDLELLKDINLQVYRGDRVGLIGANGIGKTTLFKLILGQLERDGGQIIQGHHVYPAYFDQEMDNLNHDKAIIDEIWDENPKLNYFEIRKILSQFLFIGDDIFKEIADLSGGERARLSLLKLMLSKANFLLMDEPTNHLDIDSKEILEDALLDYEGTVFVISHDRYFLNRVTNKILDLTQKGINEYLGNYDYYLEKTEESDYEDPYVNEKTRTQIKLERRRERQAINEERARKREIADLEEAIHSYEKKIEEIDLALADPDSYDDIEKILSLTEKREDFHSKLEKKYEKWLSLS